MTVWNDARNGGKSSTILLQLWNEVLKPAPAMLREWRRWTVSRRELARLDDRMLRDIGINRADVFQELNKSFWGR
jgi:uncharacterized protein YjiS (DUF1127 family)